MRVLIVEDDSRLLTQLDQLLQQSGYSVDLADDGAKALYGISCEGMEGEVDWLIKIETDNVSLTRFFFLELGQIW